MMIIFIISHSCVQSILRSNISPRYNLPGMQKSKMKHTPTSYNKRARKSKKSKISKLKKQTSWIMITFFISQRQPCVISSYAIFCSSTPKQSSQLRSYTIKKCVHYLYNTYAYSDTFYIIPCCHKHYYIAQGKCSSVTKICSFMLMAIAFTWHISSHALAAHHIKQSLILAHRCCVHYIFLAALLLFVHHYVYSFMLCWDHRFAQLLYFLRRSYFERSLDILCFYSVFFTIPCIF